MWTAPLALIGRNTLGLIRYASGLSELSVQTAYWTFVAPFKGLGLKGRSAVHQAVLVGYSAVPIVSVISFFIGMVLAFQGAYQLEKLGATYFVAALVGVSMTRELGPLITAVVVAGRSGSAFAAEIGTMKVSEEIDALEVMGLNSVKYLVVPKYLAMLVMMPCLTLLSDAEDSPLNPHSAVPLSYQVLGVLPFDLEYKQQMGLLGAGAPSAASKQIEAGSEVKDEDVLASIREKDLVIKKVLVFRFFFIKVMIIREVYLHIEPVLWNKRIRKSFYNIQYESSIVRPVPHANDSSF